MSSGRLSLRSCIYLTKAQKTQTFFSLAEGNNLLAGCSNETEASLKQKKEWKDRKRRKMRESSLPTRCNAANYKNLIEEQTEQIHYGGASHSCVMNGKKRIHSFDIKFITDTKRSMLCLKFINLSAYMRNPSKIINEYFIRNIWHKSF